MPSAKNCNKFKDKQSINAFHNILHTDIKRLNKKYVAHFLQHGNYFFSLTMLSIIMPFIVTN